MTAGSGRATWDTSTSFLRARVSPSLDAREGRTIVRGRFTRRDRVNPAVLRAGTAFSGQAIVELALILPVFLLVLCAMIDLGRWVYTQNALDDAAHVAVRTVTVTSWPLTCAGDPMDVCARKIVLSRVAAVGGVPAVTTICYVKDPATPKPLSSCDTDDFVQVRATVDPWAVLTPFLSGFVTAHIDAAAQDRMR